MLRTILATAATFALAAGPAGAQGTAPGAAAIDGYHERFVDDSTPDRTPPPSSGLVDEALSATGPRLDGPVIDEPGFEETIELEPVGAPIPGAGAPPADTVAPTGLTPGAPLGSDSLSDGKVVAGEARRLR